MKTLSTPEVPGNNPWKRMDNAVRMVLTVPKAALLKEETKTKRARARKRAAKKK